MLVEELLAEARKIWPEKNTLPEIAVALIVVAGDVARCARGAKKDAGEEIDKELGNLVLSALRWMDDLGYDPAACVEKAFRAQRAYVEEEGGLTLCVCGHSYGAHEAGSVGGPNCYVWVLDERSQRGNPCLCTGYKEARP